MYYVQYFHNLIFDIYRKNVSINTFEYVSGCKIQNIITVKPLIADTHGTEKIVYYWEVSAIGKN